MPQPIQYGGAAIDLSPRLFSSAAVVASPAAATETIVASVTINEDLAVMEGVLLLGMAAFTAGTNAVGGQLKLRRTDASGQTVKDTGAVTVVATKLYAPTVVGFDAFKVSPGGVYVLTMTMASGSAESTVTAVSLVAIVV